MRRVRIAVVGQLTKPTVKNCVKVMSSNGIYNNYVTPKPVKS